ncbi:MAG: Tn3 family transposase [Steroidobacteraceae bacterium]
MEPSVRLGPMVLLRWTWDEPMHRGVHKGTTKVERSHQFSKYLNFGGEGGMRTKNPADQDKGIVRDELVAYAVALQTVADHTQPLHELRQRGIEIPAEDLAYFSAYPTSRVKRFGEYPASIKMEIWPPNRKLPTQMRTPVAPAA